jgi:hypothetical protein
MMRQYYRTVVFLAACVLVLSCATPGAPTGGPVDKTPPKVIRFVPEKLTRNFEDKVIRIYFDEWIQVQDVQRQVIISPPLEPMPEITARKEELIIRFKSPLLNNTTYSIFLGDAVKDMREGNQAENIQYVFSTGPEIDSLQIEGKLITLEGVKVPENTFVMLYRSEDDSIIVKEKPLYAYKVKEGWSDFKFNYLPSGSYKVLALSDNNRNFLYDLPTEWIGAFPMMIQLDSNMIGLEIFFSLAEEEKMKIREYNTVLQNGILNLKLNKRFHPEINPISVRMIDAGTVAHKTQYYSSDAASFFLISDSNSTSCVVMEGDRIVDTIKVRKDPKGRQAGILSTMPGLSTNDAILSVNKNDVIFFNSSIPVQHIDSDRVFLKDSNDLSVDLNLFLQQDEWKFQLSGGWDLGMSYSLSLGDSAVSFLNGTFSSKLDFTIKVLTPPDPTGLIATVHLPSKDICYVVSVKTSQGKVLKEALIKGDSIWMFQDKSLKPGDYFIEVLEDLNSSGTWNGSSYWQKRLPERVWRSEKITLKENWEQELEFKPDFSKPVLPLAPPDEKPTAPAAVNPLSPAAPRSGGRPMFDR